MNEKSLVDSQLPSGERMKRESSTRGRDTSSPLGADRAGERLLIVAPLVVQYSSPLFREIAQQTPLTLLVAYCSMQGAETAVDPGFGVTVSWDTPQLEGYPWVHVPNRALRPGVASFFGLFNPGLWTLIREGRFDAVLICGYYFASAWIALVAAKWYGTPTLFVSDSHSLRSWRVQSPWRLRVKKMLLRRIFSLLDGVVVSSSGGVEYLKSLGFPGERIVLAPTAVDNNWWIIEAAKVDRNVVRAEWKIPADGTVTLFCAKLQLWKGPMDLLEAFAQANVPNSYLAFAGDGAERANLERRATELGIVDRVRFLGFLNQSQLPSAYCAADLFVLPSLFEPFGMVINEAMLCGLPVVVSDRVGARFDLVRPDENGYVFPAGDVGALAAVLRRILPDAGKRTNMGAMARKRMETWSPQEYVASIVKAVKLVAKK